MQKAMLILAATFAAFLSVGGVSDDVEVRGRVVKVADGDTITILVATGTTGVSPVANTAPLGQRASCPLPTSPTQHKIRLHGIDAPESHQAFGHKSKQHLSSLVFGDNKVECERKAKELAAKYKVELAKRETAAGPMVFEVNYDMKSVEVSLVSAAHARLVAKAVADR